MGLLSIFSRTKYDDPQIEIRATRAIEEDAIVHHAGQVIVSSKNGVVTLTGSVNTEIEKAHLEGVARSAIKMSGLKFADIVNEIVVGR